MTLLSILESYASVLPNNMHHILDLMHNASYVCTYVYICTMYVYLACKILYCKILYCTYCTYVLATDSLVDREVDGVKFTLYGNTHII